MGFIFTFEVPDDKDPQIFVDVISIGLDRAAHMLKDSGQTPEGIRWIEDKLNDHKDRLREKNRQLSVEALIEDMMVIIEIDPKMTTREAFDHTLQLSDKTELYPFRPTIEESQYINERVKELRREVHSPKDA